MRKRSLAVLAAAILVVSSLAVFPGLIEAASSLITIDGHILTLGLLADQYDPTQQGLVLYDESASGLSTETIISRWDPLANRTPDLALNPLESQPLIVWSRQDGNDFELALMRRRPGGYWEPMQVLTNNQSHDLEPRVIADGNETAHIVWWPSGVGGPVFLRSFDIRNGHGIGQVQKPFEAGNPKNKLNTGVNGGSSLGGSEDPGLIGGLSVTASADPCPANPAAVPDHGVVLGCGRPAAYQLSACKLLIGIQDAATSTWNLTVVDVTHVSLSSTPARQMVQTLVDSGCLQ